MQAVTLRLNHVFSMAKHLNWSLLEYYDWIVGGIL